MIETSPAARDKRALRTALREQRQALPALERMHAAEAIAGLLLGHPALAQPGYLAAYWAMSGEVPLHVLQMRVQAGLVWCLPCIQPDDSLRFCPWRPGDALLGNRFGIPEPVLAPESQLLAAEMSVILLPLLGFSRSGQRLGTGGGYYDRSLAFRQQLPAPPLLIGVGYSFQESSAWQNEPWDVQLDAVVTEREFIDCSREQ